MDETQERVAQFEKRLEQLARKVDRMEGCILASQFLLINAVGGFDVTPHKLNEALSAFQQEPSFNRVKFEAFVGTLKEIQGAWKLEFEKTGGVAN